MITLLDPLVIKLLIIPLIIIIGLLLYNPIISLAILCFLVPMDSLIGELPFKLFPLLGGITFAGYLFNAIIHMNRVEHNKQVTFDYIVMGLLVLCFIWNPEYAWGTADPSGQKSIWAITYIQLAIIYFLGSRLLRGDKLPWLGVALMLGTTISAIYTLKTMGFEGFQTGYSSMGLVHRLGGAQGDPNTFAAYALCSLALLPAVQKLFKNNWQIYLVTLIGGFQIIIVFMTMSKTALLGLAFLMLMWCFSLNLGSFVRRNIIIGIGILLVTVLVIPGDFWKFMYDSIVAGILRTDQKMGGSMKERYHLWRLAILAFKSAPILGIGVGQFKWFTVNSVGLGIDYSTVPHNAYLTVLAENGMVGLILYLGLIVLAVYRFYEIVRKHKKDNLGILAFSGLSAFLMILFMSLTLTIQYDKIFWLLAGSSIALKMESEKANISQELKYSCSISNRSNLLPLSMRRN